ncbi:MAG TPA: hypothetical protein VGD69_21485 [Herpetosiphonaceae bacterium]
MTLTVTLNLSPEAEAELRESIAQRDSERIRQMLTDALTPTVEALLREQDAQTDNSTEWEELAEQLIETFSAAAPADLPVLSDYATSRAGIYEEHA